jgi:secreted Zn-dependent insulinase-like peptidase
MKLKIAILLLLTNLISAQIKGVVKDSITSKPISFVNIWVENENIAATTEEDGTFVINTTSKSQKLFFSALGFEKKSVKLAEASMVSLKPISYELQEINILKKLETKQIEIGKTASGIYQAFDNGPKIDVKFFPYKPSYKKTKFIKQLRFQTDSKVENATVKIHFYSVDSLGSPGKELLKKDLIITVKKGVNNSRVNISERNLILPKNGLYVGFEKLNIESNKEGKSYYPFILYSREERDFAYTFTGGKWHKEIRLANEDSLTKFRVFEPAINLILSN